MYASGPALGVGSRLGPQDLGGAPNAKNRAPAYSYQKIEIP